MTFATTSKPGKGTEIQSLTSQSQHLAKSVDSWNDGYVWLGAVAVIVALLVFLAQYKIIKRGRQLSAVQTSLLAAKERQSKEDSKDKDLKIAEAQESASKADQKAKEAGERAANANERAGKAEEHANKLAVETETLRHENLELTKYLGQRIPSNLREISSTLAEFRGNKVYFQAAPGEEPFMLAVFLQQPFRSAMWQSDWSIRPISGEDTALTQAFFGPMMDDGVVISCGVPSPPGTRSCWEATDKLVDMLNSSGIAAMGLPTEDVPPNVMLIRVGPRPTLDESKRLIEVHKRNKALREMQNIPPNAHPE